MSDKVIDLLVTRLNRTHEFILNVVKDLSNDDICLRPAPTAPPIGWHVWHITRWADWFQASFPDQLQIWEQRNMLKTLGLDHMSLGPMETGLGMDHDDAANIPRIIGKTKLIDYMQTVFQKNQTVLIDLAVDDLYKPRESFAKWAVVDNKIVRAKGKDVVLIDDIGYHLSHANRHLGMIEGLIGATLNRSGTASI